MTPREGVFMVLAAMLSGEAGLKMESGSIAACAVGPRRRFAGRQSTRRHWTERSRRGAPRRPAAPNSAGSRSRRQRRRAAQRKTLMTNLKKTQNFTGDTRSGLE